MKTEQRLKEIKNNLPSFVRLDHQSLMIELTDPTYVAEKPRLYQVETTSKCNLKCGFCPRTTDLIANQVRDMNADMNLDNFKRLLDQMPWLRSIELFHFGEPFMQKNIHEFIQECTNRNIYTVIASNLLPATNEKLNKAFEAGLNFLVMDVDSLDKERYEDMRKGGRYEQMKERVLYILSHHNRPYCVAQTIMIDGIKEYTEEEFIEWTGGLMADEVRYKFFDTFRGTNEVDKQLLQADDVCREAFYGFTVHVNGNVVPCDRDWAGEHVMGNVFESSVMDIWNGDKFKTFRSQMLSADKPKICKTCAEGKLFNGRSQPEIQVNMFKGNEI